MTITLKIPELAPSLNGSKGLMRMHYQQYRRVRETWSTLALSALRSHPEWRYLRRPVAARVSVEIERRYASHPLDLDNLYAASKVPLDALRRSGIIRDDDPDTVTALRCTQIKVDRRAQQGTVITLRRDSAAHNERKPKRR